MDEISAGATQVAHRFTYGPRRAQYAVLEAPPGSGPFPGVVLLHGGFWRMGFNRTLMNPLALDLLGRGWAVWNLEHRRLGIGWGAGGGWPETFEDVAAGIDALADVPVTTARRPAPSARPPSAICAKRARSMWGRASCAA